MADIGDKKGVIFLFLINKPTRSFNGALFDSFDAQGKPIDGTPVPGSLNAKTCDADSLLQSRSKTECLNEVTYEGDTKGLQQAISSILQDSHV